MLVQLVASRGSCEMLVVITCRRAVIMPCPIRSDISAMFPELDLLIADRYSGNLGMSYFLHITDFKLLGQFCSDPRMSFLPAAV